MADGDAPNQEFKPSEQRGGTTADANELREKGLDPGAADGIVPPELGGSDAPQNMLDDEDPQLGSAVLGQTTGADQPATDAGIDSVPATTLMRPPTAVRIWRAAPSPTRRTLRLRRATPTTSQPGSRRDRRRLATDLPAPAPHASARRGPVARRASLAGCVSGSRAGRTRFEPGRGRGRGQSTSPGCSRALARVVLERAPGGDRRRVLVAEQPLGIRQDPGL